MSKRKVTCSIFVLFALLFILVPLVRAAITANVTATVTAQNISVTLTSDGSVAFGTITTSSTQDTTSSGVNDTETAQNNGNITEDFNIKAGDSTNWTLAGTADSETYTMDFCTSDCDGTPTWTDVGIDPSYVTLASGVSASGTQDFDLQVGTPTSTSSYGEQSITVTIQAIDGT